MSNSNKIIWNYFEKNPNDKIAVCLLCNKKISYKTTITNLKQHLKLKHISSFNELLSQEPPRPNNDGSRPIPVTASTEAPSSSSVKRRRYTHLLIWNYFEKNPNDKIAECLLCHTIISYRTTISNLKQHLKLKHISCFNELVAQKSSRHISEPRPISVETSSEGSSSDEEAEELLKVKDIWSYFATDAAQKARCIVCEADLTNKYEELKAHLKDKHPNLLLQIMQDNDQLSDAAAYNVDDDNDNTYTEIVYLEQEPLTDTIIIDKETVKSFPTPETKLERVQSSDEIPIKKAKDDEIDELGIFIKYITCLLKKLPAHVFTNVQIEIVNVILKANSELNNSRSMAFNQNLGSTSSNISNIITVDPINNTAVAQNYTFTLAPNESGIKK